MEQQFHTNGVLSWKKYWILEEAIKEFQYVGYQIEIPSLLLVVLAKIFNILS